MTYLDYFELSTEPEKASVVSSVRTNIRCQGYCRSWRF